MAINAQRISVISATRKAAQAQAGTHLLIASKQETALNCSPPPPFGLSLSKPCTFLKRSEALRHLSETAGSLKQGERRRGDRDIPPGVLENAVGRCAAMTLQARVVTL
ncbi:hypothetical protein [Sphingobium sp. TomTYG45]